MTNCAEREMQGCLPGGLFLCPDWQAAAMQVSSVPTWEGQPPHLSTPPITLPPTTPPAGLPPRKRPCTPRSLLPDTPACSPARGLQHLGEALSPTRLPSGPRRCSTGSKMGKAAALQGHRPQPAHTHCTLTWGREARPTAVYRLIISLFCWPFTQDLVHEESPLQGYHWCCHCH